MKAASERGSKVQRPSIIAHRGAAGEAPENTMAAFELAGRQGADAIEFDVHLSADGVPVVIHDARLDRTTSGSGPVRRFSLKALQRLDVGSWFNQRHPDRARAAYARQRIPLLADVLTWAKQNQRLCFLELKAGSRIYPQIERRVLEEIERAEVPALTTIISFDHAALRRLRELDPEISLGASFRRPVLAIRRAKSIQACCVAPQWALTTHSFVRRAHGAGLDVIVWTVSHPPALRRAVLSGVDGIITDFPARLVEVLSALQSWRRVYPPKQIAA